MRRRLAASAIALVALAPAGAALATAPPSSPPDSEPAGTEGTGPATTDGDSSATTAEDAGASAVATIYNDEREPVAEVSVAGTETSWTDYSEDDAPDEGREYFRMTVNVESLVTDEDAFGISVGDFVLQDTHGFLDDADTVRTAAQAESDEEVTEEVDLASGESVELTLTFEFDASADPLAVFYSSDDPNRLVLVGDATA